MGATAIEIAVIMFLVIIAMVVFYYLVVKPIEAASSSFENSWLGKLLSIPGKIFSAPGKMLSLGKI